MNLLIVSDTHGDLSLVKKYIKANQDFDGVIHLGDYYRDGEIIAGLVNKPIYQVRGNCDPKESGEEELVIELEGVRLFICHGHKYNVKWGINQLYYRALEMNADVILFGHSHQQVCIEEEGMLFINPGSASQPRDQKSPNIGVLTIEEKKTVRYTTIY